MPVYIIRAGKSGTVKIGWANHAGKRLQALQISHPDRLTIIRLIDGTRATERWMHERFASLRQRGEWFTFDPVMMTVIPDDPPPVQPPVVVAKREAPPPAKRRDINTFCPDCNQNARQWCVCWPRRSGWPPEEIAAFFESQERVRSSDYWAQVAEQDLALAREARRRIAMGPLSHRWSI